MKITIQNMLQFFSLLLKLGHLFHVRAHTNMIIHCIIIQTHVLSCATHNKQMTENMGRWMLWSTLRSMVINFVIQILIIIIIYAGSAIVDQLWRFLLFSFETLFLMNYLISYWWQTMQWHSEIIAGPYYSIYHLLAVILNSITCNQAPLNWTYSIC